MNFVYIIKSLKNKSLYIGITNNINRRLREHNAYDTFSTKRYAPWKVVYLEGYGEKEDAEDREVKLKQFGKVYSQLKRRISRSLQS
jgi:putative endonuclease